MVRGAAILLLLVFSVPLIPAIPVSSTKLPACCRKDGKHHCSMKSTAGQSTDTGEPALQSDRQACPFFPKFGAPGSQNFAATLRPSYLFFAAIVSHPTAQEQTHAQYRVSFSRSWSKRGPPLLA